ncbi:uncharacterized protein LOC144256438 [Urocitellus parryii]
MAVFFSPSPDGGAEMNLDGEPQNKLKEIIQGLQAELQEQKLNFRDLEEKFIVCQSTVYTLANQFQKYRSGAKEENGKEQELLVPSLRQAPQEEKEILQDVLNEGCNTCPGHSESSDIQQAPCFSADLLEHHDNEDNDKEESLYFSCLSSLNSELKEDEENDLQLDEKYFRYSGHPDSCDTEELDISSVLPSHEPNVSSTVDGTKLNLDTCIELQNLPKLEGDALGGLAVKTPECELHVLTDTMSVLKQKIMKRKQLFCKWRMACRFPVLQASEHVFSDATGVSKQKIITRKILMSKRKLACRFPGLQASELDSNDPSGMKNSLKLEGDTKDGSFANNHGCHIIGHIDDYTALREQIGEGKQLVEKIQSLLRPTCNFLGLEAQGSEAPGSKCFHELRSSAHALQHTLEESASLLTMFWRAALPSFQGPGLPGKVDESMERELLDLRAQVSKQEKLLESTAERLKTANQQKENMENFIVSQLTRTHDVLKKARTNLELKQRLHLTQSRSLLQIHHHLTSDQ